MQTSQSLAALAALWCLTGCAAPGALSAPGAPRGAVEPSASKDWSFGAELQAYPAGVQATAVAVYPLSESDRLSLRAGYNATDRQDWGEHDQEDGGGPGFGIGFHHLFTPQASEGWLVGAKLDLWWLDIDWEEDSAPDGSTDVTVLQPTAEGGYRWDLDGGASVALTLSVGAEINVDTDGEDVGEGAIVLLGLRYLF